MKTYLVLTLLLMSACQAKQEFDTTKVDMMRLPPPEAMPKTAEPMFEPEIMPDIPMPPQKPQQPKEEATLPPPTERQIIRNASVRFQVKNVGEASKKVERLVKSLGGIITHAEELRQYSELRHDLSIKIPAVRLDTFLVMMLKESIYTESKSITAEDVTKRYIDLTARIKAQKATEEKYLEILKKARNVEEVLKVEEQLAKMREEIEAREAQLRELKYDVAMSSVQASLYERIEGTAAPEDPFYAKIWSNLKEGFGLLSQFLIGIFYFLPIVGLVAVVVWLWVRWRRKRKV
ncbi:MAG: DUF4349 domain-containing protein [Runella sp.]